MRFLGRSFVLVTTLASAAVGLLCTGPVHADTMPIIHQGLMQKHFVGAGVGTHGPFSFWLQYGRRFRSVFGPWMPLQLSASLTLPTLQIYTFDAARLRAMISGLVAAQNGFGVSAGLGPDVTYSRDALANTFAFGAEVVVRPGRWWKSGASIMLDIRYRMGYSTCILHRNAFPDLYGDRYPGSTPAGAVTAPQDGCLPMTVHQLRTGILFGLQFGYLAGGFQYNPNLGGVISSYPLTSLPFYLELGYIQPIQ